MQGTPGRGEQGDALRAIRVARRRRFVGQLDLMEVLYRVYVSLIFGAIALALIAGVVQDADPSLSAIDEIRADGPAVAGLLVAFALLAGLRMGARGGPLAIESAELQYVLLAPVDRGAALRMGAFPQLRVAALGGAAVGLVAANFAFRRLPGSPPEWFACLAVFGASVPLATLGCGLAASGRRLKPALAGALGWGLVAWSLADLALGAHTSPATMVGVLATLPLQSGATAAASAIGIALVAAIVIFGLRSLGGLSLQAARRRAQLAAELRFSASVQDLRAVVLLRRQLSSERPRRRPWLRLRAPAMERWPVPRRGLQSLLRWPPPRIARALATGVLAGALAAGAWSGTTPLVVLPGLVLMVAALDLVEPLAQEVDHPSRRDLLPVRPEALVGRHLLVPAMTMIVVTLAGALTAFALGPSATVAAVGALMAVPTAIVLVCCAAISASNDPYAHVLSPQVGYAVTAAPIVIASVAVAGPLIAARESVRVDRPALAAAGSVELFALIAAGCLAAWLRSRIAQRTAVAP